MPTTEIVPFTQYAVANLEATELAEILSDNLAGEDISEFSFPRVKVPSGGGKSWELETVRGTESLPMLEGVLIGHKSTRAFYPSPFAGENQPPSCSSPDAKIGRGHPGATPDDPFPDSEPVSLECSECPNSQWGSAPDQRGQACQLRRVLGILRPGSVLPTILDLPPTSTKAVSKFLLGLASEGISYKRAIIGITLEPATNATGIRYSEARFELRGLLDDEAQTRVRVVSDALAAMFT